MATDVVRGTVIGEVSRHFKVTGTFFMEYGGSIIREKETEIHVWRPADWNGRQVVDSILSEEWKTEVSSTGVKMYHTVESLMEKTD